MKRSLTRKIINALGLTTAMFIFQACYGSPNDFGYDVRLEGTVKSKKTGLPIKGIRVSVAENIQYGTTDDIGHFVFYAPKFENMIVSFEDIDMSQNGLYSKKDTVIANPEGRIVMDIKLDEK
jgi:hypothetical protein